MVCRSKQALFILEPRILLSWKYIVIEFDPFTEFRKFSIEKRCGMPREDAHTTEHLVSVAFTQQKSTIYQ